MARPNSMPPEPGPDAGVDDIQADIERTRKELGETVGALSDKLDVKERTKQKAAVNERARHRQRAHRRTGRPLMMRSAIIANFHCTNPHSSVQVPRPAVLARIRANASGRVHPSGDATYTARHGCDPADAFNKLVSAPATPQSRCGGLPSVRYSAVLSRCGWGGRCAVAGHGRCDRAARRSRGALV